MTRFSLLLLLSCCLFFAKLVCFDTLNVLRNSQQVLVQSKSVLRSLLVVAVQATLVNGADEQHVLVQHLVNVLLGKLAHSGPIHSFFFFLFLSGE